MRDPYLYDDVNVLKNLADIKDSELLRKAEADITGLSMATINPTVSSLEMCLLKMECLLM